MNILRCAWPVLLLAASVVQAGEETKRFYGYAFDVDGKRYLYTEIYEQVFLDGKWVRGSTQYLDAGGKPFATKTLAFTQSRHIPVYRLEIPGQGYSEGITSVGETIEMVRRKRGDEDSETIEQEGTMVADAGLPVLLLDKFDRLLKGKKVSFRVVAPGRLSDYKFVAKRIEDTTFEGKPAVVIEVAMDSMLSLFAGPLRFTFDAETRAMREFRGTTNLLDADGEMYVVRISYGSSPPKGAPELPPLK